MTRLTDETGKGFPAMLPEELAKRLAEAVKRTGMSREGLIELALKHFLKPEAGGSPVYLSAPVNALMKGIYRERTTIADVKKHGDFGLGTFNNLDGEMMLLDNVAYQLRTDGLTSVVAENVQTPFACASFFNPLSVEEVQSEMDYAAFKALLGRLIPSQNLFHAIRVDGEFRRIKMWSVTAQPDRRPINQVHPVPFEFYEVKGTLAGFFTPQFMKDLCMPGFHLHFLTDDRSHGGHLIECAMRRARIGVQLISHLELDLPTTFDYLTAELS
ncbi:MAG: acetolactate decarboxylase [Deltaproteobacteria bacterium]|jgi:acetolactate decarboxylase|nr:acetolactate decarboxylase [Deltaproteobacteria bacterium]